MTAILKVDTIQDTAGNNIINESSDTITIGASGDTIALAGTTVTGITQGITMADQWRVTSNVYKASSSDVTANWEQIDTNSQGIIGSSMTQSSGIFTFPSTGVYLILANMYLYPDGVRTYSGQQIKVTTDNSTYNTANEEVQHTTAGLYYISVASNILLDVTDTSNVKIKLKYTSNGGATLFGDTSVTFTGMTFIRLGDT